MLRRLLIVDDEAYVVDGIFDYLYRRLEDELDIVKAYSATEALTCIGSMHVDIVLSDINMPDTDGITLCTEINHRWPDCQIIFLTAYDHFDYAYRALKTANAQFLLKSEGYVAILEAVQKCFEVLEKQDKQRLFIQRSEALIMEKSIDERTILSQKVLMSHTSINALLQIFKDCSSSLTPQKPVWVAICNRPSDVEISFLELLGKRFFQTQFSFLLLMPDPNHLLWIFQPNDAHMPDVASVLRGSIESFQIACESRLLTQLTFSLLRNALSFTVLEEGVKMLISSLDHSTHMGLRVVNNFADANSSDMATMRDLLEKTRKNDSTNELIQRVHSFIEQEYVNNITLNDIAEHVYMNPAYLCRLYKQTCGRNLFEYICTIRIEKSKALLLETDDKIFDIAFAVGFNSVGYFSSTFRKRTGVTPQTYRTEHKA